MTAEPLRTCPQCGKDTLKRIMGGGAGMIFKGQGFYLTDYKKSGPEKKGSSSPAKKEDSKPKESPGESKPDSPGPTKPSPPADKKP